MFRLILLSFTFTILGSSLISHFPAPHNKLYAGENAGLFIDEKGQAKLIKDDLKGLPKEFQDELKNYKLCNVKFDKIEESKIEKALDDAMVKWKKDLGD